MDTANQIEKEIAKFTSLLVRFGLCDEQNMPSKKKPNNSGIVDISLSGAVAYSAAMKNIDYVSAYKEIDSSNSYNIKMIDGGLLQLLYRINSNNKLFSHRLAFYSSPSHETYQAEPDIYETDSIYADFLKKNIVPFPIRFDFNNEDKKHIDIDHPKSHLTLGQYEACRIPVSSPIGPGNFIKFILRNFYNSAYKKYTEISRTPSVDFSSTITETEKKVEHLCVSSPPSLVEKMSRSLSHLKQK